MADSYYVEVRFKGQTAVLLVTSDGKWQLRQDNGLRFLRYGGQRGSWKEGFAQVSVVGFYTDETEPPRFNMSDVKFPPSVKPEPDFLLNRFYLGDHWAKSLGYRDATEAATTDPAHWYPVASGALMAWIKQYCEERIEELKQLAVTLSLNVGAMVDQTGALSFLGAVDASMQGDYLGCVLNLVGAIPLFGTIAKAARRTQIVLRMERILNECRMLQEWMSRSKAILQRAAVSDEARALRGLLSAARSRVTETVVKALENRGWILKMDPKDYDRLGMLPKEIEALQALAKQGYYFVVRACNPERVRWLTWAAKASVRVLAKPLWIKAKSLKNAGFLSGLVGYRFKEGMTAERFAQLATKVSVPAGFSARFLENGGGTMKALYRMNPRALKTGFGITDEALAADHFLVESGECFILVDAHGAPYVSDLDVVLVQKRLPSGAFGPPGMNVGADGVAFKGGDNAELRPFWDKIFSRVGYPPGYQAIQHGEATGTAGNFKKAGAKFAAGIDTRLPVWNPGSTWDTEELIVAVLAPHLSNGVGYTKGWETLKHFHQANPMGEFRIPNLSGSLP